MALAAHSNTNYMDLHCFFRGSRNAEITNSKDYLKKMQN